MPTYIYECGGCSIDYNIEKPLAELDREELCKVCGKPMKRIPAPTSFHLKGGGWYKDGYSNSGCDSRGDCKDPKG